MRILLAEDEADLNRLITKKLTAAGYTVDSCLDGAAAIDHAAVYDYDAAVLDILMPGADGYAVLRALRARSRTTPVLFLTALDAVEERVRGLDSGANDYLVKPFSFAELTARIRAMTRRPEEAPDELTAADLVMNLSARTVRRGGRSIELSAREFALLEYLLRHRGTVLSRETLEEHVWGMETEGGTNVVAVYVNYLRAKLDADFEPKLIHTVRGAGYVLREETP